MGVGRISIDTSDDNPATASASVSIFHATIVREEEKLMSRQSVVGVLVLLAAVTLAAGGVIGAERTVVVEHFTATW